MEWSLEKSLKMDERLLQIRMKNLQRLVKNEVWWEMLQMNKRLLQIDLYLESLQMNKRLEGSLMMY